MLNIPSGETSLVVRTDFSNEVAWQAICQAVEQPNGEFRAYVQFINNVAFDQATVDQLVNVGRGSGRSFLLVVDGQTVQDLEHALLAIDLWEDPGRTFRFIPSETPSVESNLSLANMDFSEFAEAVGEDGIFRGFE